MASAVATATSYQCKWASCRTICSSDQALYEHLLEDHTAPWQNRNVSPYQRLACQWTGCETEPNWQRLRDHLITHTNYRPFVCDVSPSCTLRFKTGHTLYLHLKRKNNHRPPMTAPCEWKACTETMANPSALFEHISKVHAESESKIICLWTECAHRSALKWKLDLRLPSWYKPILYKPDERGKTSLMHAHMNAVGVGAKKRKREGKKSAKAGDGEDAPTGDVGTMDKLQVKSKRQCAPAPERTDGKSEDDKVEYVDDVNDAHYALARRTSRRGAKRLRKSGVEDEEEDRNVAPSGRMHKAKPLRAGDSNVGDDGDDEDMAHRCNAKRCKVHAGEFEDEDVACEDNNCIPSPSPSLSWTSESALGSASSPAVVAPEQEQEYSSASIAAADLRSDIDTDKRLAAVELRAKTLEVQLAAAFSVIRQSKVLCTEWTSRMSESADEVYEPQNSVTEMILDQDTQTMTMEDELESDDWTLWVTGARGAL